VVSKVPFFPATGITDEGLDVLPATPCRKAITAATLIVAVAVLAGSASAVAVTLYGARYSPEDRTAIFLWMDHVTSWLLMAWMFGKRPIVTVSTIT
jgi:hypothetical protein